MHSSATAPIPVIPCPGSAPRRLLPRFLLLGVGVLAGNLVACSEDKSKVGTDSAAAAPAPASVPSTRGASIAAPVPAPVTDPSAALANAMSTPARAAETFYRTKLELKIDGLLQEWQLASLTGTITPELNRVFDKASFTQAAFIINKKEGKPPWIEGDLFSSLFEGVTTFKTGEASITGTITGTTAEVPLALTHTANGQTTQWTDHVILKQVQSGGWLVDDLRYGGTWDAAVRGTLRQRLTPPTP